MSPCAQYSQIHELFSQFSVVEEWSCELIVTHDNYMSFFSHCTANHFILKHCQKKININADQWHQLCCVIKWKWEITGLVLVKVCVWKLCMQAGRQTVMGSCLDWLLTRMSLLLNKFLQFHYFHVHFGYNDCSIKDQKKKLIKNTVGSRGGLYLYHLGYKLMMVVKDLLNLGF